MHIQPSRPAAPRQPDVVTRMAAFLQRHEAAAGGVTRDDLLLQFSGEEIDRHFQAAKTRAARGSRQ